MGGFDKRGWKCNVSDLFSTRTFDMRPGERRSRIAEHGRQFLLSCIHFLTLARLIRTPVKSDNGHFSLTQMTRCDRTGTVEQTSEAVECKVSKSKARAKRGLELSRIQSLTFVWPETLRI